jgi:DNA-binding response OmpR family regulator
LYVRPLICGQGQKRIIILFYYRKFTHALSPDLVILDIHMPMKSGIEVLREIRADIILKHIPVIILTSSGNEHDIKDTFEDNANCYIVKPFDFNQFPAAIDILSIDLLSGFKTR